VVTNEIFFSNENPNIPYKLLSMQRLFRTWYIT